MRSPPSSPMRRTDEPRDRKTKQRVDTSAAYVSTPPASPIHSKTRAAQSPSKGDGRWAHAYPKTIFSPTQWKKQKALEKCCDKKKNGKNKKHESCGPQGDPLGVMFTLLEEDPDILIYMKNLPRRVPARFLRRKPVLQKKSLKMPKNTIVLDLDETLVHCTTDPIEQYDTTFNVEFSGHQYCVYMRKRPFMEDFLERCSKWFEVVIFTASQECYADTLLDVVDPERKMIHHRVFRESCAQYKDNFLKPLNILNRKLENAFIIDNSPQCFGFQVENGIPITSWFEDPKDDELMQLLPFLEEMKDMDDVRPYITETFRVREFLDKVPNWPGH